MLTCLISMATLHTHVQVYMDWANHYLRKAGHSTTLSDLKEISDGHFLPQIIQAVGKRERERETSIIIFSLFAPVHGEIPGIIEAVQSEEDRVS